MEPLLTTQRPPAHLPDAALDALARDDSADPTLRAWVRDAEETLRDDFLYVTLPEHPPRGVDRLEIATRLCAQLGDWLDVYGDGQRWSELRVSLDAMPMRTHGVGENPLHIDYMDRSEPPDRIAFFGARADPLGGGATQLASFPKAVAALSVEHRATLQRAIFTYWTDHGARMVGEHLPAFPVVPEKPGVSFTRFSAKAIRHIDGTDTVIVADAVPDTETIREAYEALYASLRAHRVIVRIMPGQLVCFDQRLLAHGRCALGPGQETLAPHERRSLLQHYLGARRS